MMDVKPDSSRGHGLQLRLGTGNSREWHVKNPSVPMYEHTKEKTINDFKMKDVKPDSSGGQRIGLVIENFKRSEPGHKCRRQRSRLENDNVWLQNEGYQT
ncbi:hypothetical protein V6N13_005886 [Hibiscus sabdariffa]|uniref:Uncharacterized protein n=1 Tax=Hibiscus sabdariffa TaxID=183260 RepID=A0ABR2EPF1_9ROSI